MTTLTPNRTSQDQPGALRILGIVSMILLIVGGLNWALVGLFEFDLVATLFGDMTAISRTVYVLVGVAALYGFYVLGRFSRHT